MCALHNRLILYLCSCMRMSSVRHRYVWQHGWSKRLPRLPNRPLQCTSRLQRMLQLLDGCIQRDCGRAAVHSRECRRVRGRSRCNGADALLAGRVQRRRRRVELRRVRCRFYRQHQRPDDLHAVWERLVFQRARLVGLLELLAGRVPGRHRSERMLALPARLELERIVGDELLILRRWSVFKQQRSDGVFFMHGR